MAQENNATHWVLGGALLLIGLFVIIALVLTRSQAEVTTVQISAAAPTIDLIRVCASDDPTGCSTQASLTNNAGTDTTQYLFVDASDTNGYDNLSTVTAAMHRSGIAIGSCDANGDEDPNYCYNNWDGTAGDNIPLCTADTASGTLTMIYQCFVTTKYWMDATVGGTYDGETWVASAQATDLTGQSSSIASITFENNATTALTFGLSEINYGSLNNGATRSTSVEATGVATGNFDVDMKINTSVTAMACDGAGSANIPVTNQVFGSQDGAYESFTSFLSTLQQDLDFETNAANNQLFARTNDVTNDATDSVFFNILIPNDVAGTCTVSATIAAFAE